MIGRAAILIFSHRPTLEWFEAIALRQCSTVLGSHPLFLICPEGMDCSEHCRLAPDLRIDHIHPSWLRNHRAYNQLKVQKFLYDRYQGYEFLLTYELDAFVFRDELDEWCDQDWDYIGAPWFEGYGFAKPNAPVIGVGNSGFSLRKTASMLRVAEGARACSPTEFTHFWNWIAGRQATTRRQFPLVQALRAPHAFPCGYHGYEDIFWSQQVPQSHPWFRVAPYEAAMKFSFEVNPARLYENCGCRLPFGCHKWLGYEPDFWKPHIEKYGYTVPLTATEFSVSQQRTADALAMPSQAIRAH